MWGAGEAHEVERHPQHRRRRGEMLADVRSRRGRRAEDLTPPVAAMRDTARALGLVYVRDGHLRASRIGTQGRRDPQKLWRHIVRRLPLGTKDWERQSGWMALAVAASGTPVEEWRNEVSDLLSALGWRTRRDPYE